MLTLAGLAIGLVVTVVPGHAGPDPATVELAAPPLPLGTLPGLAIVMILMLASGVSLGPENPILAVNIGLAVGIGLRLIPRVPVAAWVGLAFAGTIGAMFGTPIAAALLMSELPGNPRIGAVGPDLRPARRRRRRRAHDERAERRVVRAHDRAVSDDAGDRRPERLADRGRSRAARSGRDLCLPARLRGIQARCGSPLVAIVVGGALLGVLGAIGGPITLFKGLAQMKELSDTVADYTAAGLLFAALIKLIAVVIASTSGFRGGRIFPSIFAAVALGLCVYTAFPQVPEAVAIAASLIGILVAVTRSGWLALFMAALMVNDPNILPLLCVVILPAWLVVTGKPEMVAKRVQPAGAAA